MNKLLVRSKVTQVVLLITMHTTVGEFEKGGVRLCLQLHDEGPIKIMSANLLKVKCT